MPTIHDLTQSRFLTKGDVQPAILVTISGFELMNVAPDGADMEKKYVLNFQETEKPLVLNKTNGNIIAQITGKESFEEWIGKKIVLYYDDKHGRI